MTAVFEMAGILVIMVLIIAGIGCIGLGIAAMLERDGE